MPAWALCTCKKKMIKKMTLVSCLPPPERDNQGFHIFKVHTLKYQDRGLSHQIEDSEYTKPPNYSGMFFTVRN